MQVPYLTPAKVGEEDVLDADGQEERKVFDLLETLELEKKCLSMNEKKLQFFFAGRGQGNFAGSTSLTSAQREQKSSIVLLQLKLQIVDGHN